MVYTIGEVAQMMDINASQIRYWENNFDELKPQKNKKGNRLFTQNDIEKVKLIHYLIKVRGLTINGAKQKLKDDREGTQHNYEIAKRLMEIKQQLLILKDNLQKEDE